MIEQRSESNVTRYYLNGHPHRPNGPAVIYFLGFWRWLQYGERHRYYGPSNNLHSSWWIHGRFIK